jgi:uncharacterized protein YbjT (DUF2867 family)
MKVFDAGSTGVIGRSLLPLLVKSGHQVLALVRISQKSRDVEAFGVKPIVVDALDREKLLAAIRKAKPEVIIHQLTALSGATGNFKRFDEEFALTNRFRTEVTDTLLVAWFR